MLPEDVKYTREHEWLRLEAGVATVGITDHAQHEMGDLVFVDLPRQGSQVEAGQPMGTVESVKAVSEVFAPVSGEIAAVNEELQAHPELINQEPHGRGWMVRITMAAEPQGLMTAVEYQTFLDGSDH